jgi:dihydrodipicolinate synthase/N-acetylneuraminate lyase
VELWNAASADDWKKARLLQKRNSVLFRILEEFGLMQGIEAILKRRGLLTKCFRQPATGLTEQQSDELHRRLDSEFEKLKF